MRRVRWALAILPLLLGVFWILPAGAQSGTTPDQVLHQLEKTDTILEKADSESCGTIALGRRGLSLVKEFFLGSVSTKVMRNARGHAVWVVD